jgi:hypothetical protein
VLDAVAVKVAEPLLQRLVIGVLILTVGVALLFTIIVMLLDNAVVVFRQLPPAIVISQVTTSPLAKPVDT